MSFDEVASYSTPEPPSRNPSKATQQENLIYADPYNRNHRNSNVQQFSQESKHFAWLKKQFKQCFGLSTDTYKKRPIYSFDGVKLAEGFNKVVATWQGLYFELKGEDIFFDHLDRDFNTARGITTYSTKGVQIIKINREDTRTTPRPHRFAVIPRGNPTRPCNPLEIGKFYVHVYQTKLQMAGNFMKTLNSKSIARTLKQMYGMRYHPRPRDLPQEPQPQDNQDLQNTCLPDYGQPTQHAQFPQWNPNPHQNNLNNNSYPQTLELNPGNKQNYPSYQQLNQSNRAYHQEWGQDRRRPLQTADASFYPLAHNPPPFPFNNQSISVPTMNPYLKSLSCVPIPSAIKQHQQLQYQPYHQLPDQRYSNLQQIPEYQNASSVQPCRTQSNPAHNTYVQQPNAPLHYQTNLPAPPFTYQHQHVQPECTVKRQPPGGTHNRK